MSNMPVYQLKITLQGIKPPIWRRVLVEKGISLDDLHDVIQAVMPWYDAHLYMFQKGRTTYGPIYSDDDREILQYESRETALEDVLKRPKDTMVYLYDFGDEWRHDVRLEKTLRPDPDVFYPVCTAGERSCPPEDVGGAWGYLEMLQALKDPNHPEHELYMDWIGDDWDPEYFEIEDANLALDEVREDANPPMLPINRQVVIMAPAAAFIDFVTEQDLLDQEEVADVLKPLVFLAPITETPDELAEILEQIRPVLMAFHLLALGLDIEGVINDLGDHVSDLYITDIYPMVFDLDYETPVMHVTEEMLTAMLVDMFEESFDEDEL